MPKKKKGGKKKKSAKVPETVLPIIKLPPHSEERNSALNGTIIRGDIRSLTRLVAHYDYGKVLTTVDINGSTPIHIAVKKAELATLEKLLSYGTININALELPVIGGNSALHHAVREQHIPLVVTLLAAGANPNLKSNSIIGDTPLQISCKLGSTDIAKMLIKSGASPEVRDNFGNNCSFWAYKYGHEKMLREVPLPPVKTPTPEEMLAIIEARNPMPALPPVKAKKKKKSDKKK